MLSPRWHWIALLACVGAAQGVGAQARPPDGAAADTDAGQAAPAGETAGSGWHLPPLRLSGNISYDFRGTRGDLEGTSTGHLVTATGSLRTYVYAPWLATVDADIGLTQGWTRQEGPGFLFGGSGAVSASLHEQITARERFITGRGRLNLFPQSRFPFEFHVERSDSRLDSGLGSTFDFQTSNIGFSQRYRPVTGEYNLLGAYDHREQTAIGYRGVQDTFSGDFSRRWKQHDLNLGLTHSRAHTDDGLDASRFSSLVARHQYAPSTILSVDTTANITRSEDRGLLATSDLQMMQVSSVGIYRQEKSPLHLTGSALGLVLRDTVTGSRLNSGSLSLGASYEVNERLRLNANAGVSGAQADSATSSAFTGALGLSYQGPSVEFQGYRYDWFASGTASTALSSSSTTAGERQSALAASAGHSLGRQWQLGNSANLSVNANQSLSWLGASGSKDTFTGEDASVTTKSLLHGIAATLQGGSGNRTGYGRVSFNDSRELGGASRFQLFNAQLSGNWEIDTQRSVTGDLTFQRTWERTDPQLFLDDPFAPSGRSGSWGASGEITYRHARLWGQPRLTFSSRLKLAQDVLKTPGFLSSLPDRETALWENRLDWGIGRLETQLVLSISVVDGQRREAIMFRIQRSFGD